MKLICNTVRPYRHFTTGMSAFILNAKNLVGEPLERAQEVVRNCDRYGSSWAPAEFVRFTVGEDAGGAFEFDAEKPLVWGMQHGTLGLCNPCLLRTEEMLWLKAALTRLGTSGYQAVEAKATEGDEDALIIVGYCETAYWYTNFMRFNGEECSFFEPQQFLTAATKCEV